MTVMYVHNIYLVPTVGSFHNNQAARAGSSQRLINFRLYFQRSYSTLSFFRRRLIYNHLLFYYSPSPQRSLTSYIDPIGWSYFPP